MKFIIGLLKKIDRKTVPWSQRFTFAAKRPDMEGKKQREKTSGSGRCESHHHAMIAVNQHQEID